MIRLIMYFIGGSMIAIGVVAVLLILPAIWLKFLSPTLSKTMKVAMYLVCVLLLCIGLYYVYLITTTPVQLPIAN